MVAGEDEQLGQLAPLVQDSNLLAMLLAKVPVQGRHNLARVCSRLCQKVRAAAPVKLAFSGEEGEAAVAIPSNRTFTGAVHVAYTVGPTPPSHAALAALLRHAPDAWPYVNSVALKYSPRCLELSSNPMALVGPLQSLALMPRLVALSLTLPRLEEADLQALAALSGLTHLDLRSSHTAQQEETTLREPVGMPPLVHLSPLANLRALELEHVSPGSHPQAVSLPPALSAVTLTPAAMVEEWLPALGACQHLQQLKIMYDTAVVDGSVPTNWQLLALLGPCLQHLTFLEMDGPGDVPDKLDTGSEDTDQQLLVGDADPPPAPFFPCLRELKAAGTATLLATQEAHWRLLEACPALVDVYSIGAAVAPPDDMGQLQLTQLELDLSPGRMQAVGLLRHCPLLEQLEVGVDCTPLDVLEALPLVPGPLPHLRSVLFQLFTPCPQLVEALAPSLATARCLGLVMPLTADGTLPDLFACCHVTQLVWQVCQQAAAEEAAEQQKPNIEDLMWSLRGCGGLVVLNLGSWTWLDARIALALAGAHPALRQLQLEGCGSLAPGNNYGARAARQLQLIRALLRPTLEVKVISTLVTTRPPWRSC